MKINLKQMKLSARLPETLGELLTDEAKRRMCSNSDVVREALMRFLRPECPTKSVFVGDLGGQI